MVTKRISFLLFLGFLFSFVPLAAQKAVTWKLAELPQVLKGNLDIKGNPLMVKTKLGDAVCFDGIDDGYFSNINPLNGMKAFTLEVVFKPDSDGYKSPRFMHLGDANGKRVMFETRINQRKEWYFDVHFNSGVNVSRTLIDSTLIHLSDKWYTLSVVAANGVMTSYVNGVKELCGSIEFSAFDSGKASLGFRQNYSSWFKGTIYMVRISPGALEPPQFLKLHNKLN